MRFSIGHRLFASVLLAILAVAAAGIMLMRQNVVNSFSEYAVQIELDRLDQLSGALAARYRTHKGWGFIPAGEERESWVSDEIARLQEQRERAELAPPVALPVAPPAAPAAPAAKAAIAPPAPLADVAAPEMPTPPAPPVAPEPALPPLPLPPAFAPPAPPPVPGAGAEQLDLHERVTLLDASERYLAGRRANAEPGARRPIEVGGKTVGYLVVARAMRPSDAMASTFLAELKDSLLLIVVASIALSALAAVLLAAHFRKPIHQLADGARALADGRLDTRLEIRRSDELGELAHSFNGLAQQLAGAEEARRQWVADTSHELRTPLSVLRAQMEAIQDGVRTASPETVAAMLRQVMSLNKLIDELYTLARADVGALACQRQRLDLWQLVCEQAEAFGQKLGAAGLALDIGKAPAHVLVLADPERMRQVLTNVFENCVRYSDAGGRVRVSAIDDNGKLAILIDDSAPAVPDAALARLAERFYRVEGSRDRAHGGAGLGLALCQRIIEAHGGELGFSHSPLGGLRVRIALELEAA